MYYLSCATDSTNRTNFGNETGDDCHKCLFVLLTFINASQDVSNMFHFFKIVKKNPFNECFNIFKQKDNYIVYLK